MIVLTLYDQEGNLQRMQIKRTRSNELFAEWCRRFDRYTKHERLP